jgi:hypothetical protein
MVDRSVKSSFLLCYSSRLWRIQYFRQRGRHPWSSLLLWGRYIFVFGLGTSKRHGNNEPTKAPTIEQRQVLKSACYRHLTQDAAAMWRQQWADSPTGEYYRRLFPSTSSEGERAIRSLYAGLDKLTGSIVCQLRTGKIGLAAFLTTIKVFDGATCRKCSRALETVPHILYDRPGIKAVATETPRLRISSTSSRSLCGRSFFESTTRNTSRQIL